MSKKMKKEDPEQNACANTQEKWEKDLQKSIHQELRVYLIGKSGSGKSETGNTLLGEHMFDPDSSPIPVTEKCKSGTKRMHGRDLVVVDGPGIFFDDNFSEENMKEELAKATVMLAPGPHVFVLVIGLSRFDELEIKAIDMYRKAFGDGIMKHLIVVFTRRDELDRKGKSLKDYVQKFKPDQKKFLESCGSRYFGINNVASEIEKEKQAAELFNVILALERANGGKFYANEDFKLAEKEVEKRIKELHEKTPAEEIAVLRATLRIEFTKGSKRSNAILAVVIVGGVGLAAAISLYLAGPAAVLTPALTGVASVLSKLTMR